MNFLSQWRSYVTSGMELNVIDPNYRKVYLINTMMLMGMVVFGFFALFNFFVTGLYDVMFIDIIGLILALITVSLLRVTQHIVLASWLVTGIIFAVSLGYIALERHHHMALLFAVFLPIFALFLLGLRTGIVVSIIYAVAILVVMRTALGTHVLFSEVALVNVAVVMIILILLTRYYEVSRAEVFTALAVSLETEKNQKAALSAKSYALTQALNELNDYKENLEQKILAGIQEKELKDKMLVQQSKMASMGEMLSSIAHQWKQPLTVVGMIVNNIKMDAHLEPDKPAIALAPEIERIAQQLTFMTETMRDFSNFFKPNKEQKEFLLAKSVDNALLLLSSELDRHAIIIENNIANTPWKLHGYENEFLQVLLNVIHNAKDALIDAVQKEQLALNQAKITFDVYEEEMWLAVCVKDNAGGIDLAVIEEIFKPYVSTKGTKGTGIGLYMSWMIINQSMQGTITAENKENGAQFTIRLPQKR